MKKPNQTFSKFILVIAAFLLHIFGVGIYAAVSSAQLESYCCQLLSGELSATESVTDYQVSADGAFAVYVVTDSADDSWSMYRVPIDKTSAAVQIDQGQAAGNVFNHLIISPDGAWIVANTSAGLLSLNSAGTSYVWLKELVGSENRSIFNDAVNASSDWVIFSLFEKQDDSQVEALFSVPITGGEPNRLTPEPVTYNWLNKPLLSPVGDQVVYGIGTQDSGVSGAVVNARLYSVPIMGGSSQLLDQIANGYQGEIKISADGNFVVFGHVASDEQSDEFLSNLNSVPIDGGEKIDLTTGSAVEITRIFPGFEVSADSQKVVFFADQRISQYSIYSNSIGGNALVNVVPYVENMIDLSPNLFHITPNGSDIIFLGHVNGNVLDRKKVGFHRVPIGGGEIVTLYERTTQRYGQIYSDEFAIDPMGQSLVFIENDAYTINLAELTTSLRSVQLSGNDGITDLATDIYLPESGIQFEFSPNGRRVFFWSGEDRVVDYGALYSVPAAGGTQTKLNDVNGSGEISYGQFSVTADSHQIVYLGVGGAGKSELFVSQAAGENVAPALTSQVTAGVFADRPFMIQISTQDANQTDTLTIEVSGLPDWITFTDNGDGSGSLTGNPTLTELGQFMITLRVSDQFGLNTEQTMTMNVVELAAEIYLPVVNQ
ncbi:MAG: putative Ig domain-containing protein [Anaerolineae bacterium]